MYDSLADAHVLPPDDEAQARHIKHIVLPVPNDRTKGVLVQTTAFGQLVVGPTAEDQEERSFAAVSAEVTSALKSQGARIYASLPLFPVRGYWACLRPVRPLLPCV